MEQLCLNKYKDIKKAYPVFQACPNIKALVLLPSKAWFSNVSSGWQETFKCCPKLELLSLVFELENDNSCHLFLPLSREPLYFCPDLHYYELLSLGGGLRDWFDNSGPHRCNQEKIREMMTCRNGQQQLNVVRHNSKVFAPQTSSVAKVKEVLTTYQRFLNPNITQLKNNFTDFRRKKRFPLQYLWV